MGGGLEGVEVDRRNGSVLWDYVQGSGIDSVDVRQKIMGGNRLMLNTLEDFHHWADRWIAGMTEKHVGNGMWEYHLVVAAI